ncbi:la-related protein 6C isoform X2 [Typha latifolia]|uniref:la-related protein 6C isoform X2 n=1 Tax=Typha latifolia TaxID=4733 RepID=UPI003C2FAB2B
MSQENKEGEIKGTNKETEANGSAARFTFNVDAPEFVPRSVCQMLPMSMSGYYYPYLQFPGNSGVGVGSDWIYFAEREPICFLPDFHAKVPGQFKSNADVIQKIVKQVEYQFSDTNLLASDFLTKIMNKEPEGYVPMSVIASWKKIKSFGVSNHMLIKALRTSTKLVVSDDGKKVRRKQPFTEREKEELQSRTVIVENLPEDYSRQNLEKIFCTVGSVKNIRICHPQEPNSARTSKGDVPISNKLHAFVEYETSEQADKAVEKLNDERNWRKGLRVRTMVRRTPRSVIRNKRLDFDHFDMVSDDDQSPSSPAVGYSKIEQLLQQNMEDNQSGAKKGWGRGRAKPHGLIQNCNGRGILSHSPQSGNLGMSENFSNKQLHQGPRMPDGTRGFTMGRGKRSPSLLGCSQIPSSGLAPFQL